MYQLQTRKRCLVKHFGPSCEKKSTIKRERRGRERRRQKAKSRSAHRKRRRANERRGGGGGGGREYRREEKSYIAISRGPWVSRLYQDDALVSQAAALWCASSGTYVQSQHAGVRRAKGRARCYMVARDGREAWAEGF